MNKDERLSQFDSWRPVLERCLEKLRDEVGFLLKREGIAIHLLSGRVKSRESLRYKLSRPDKTYKTLWNVSDLIGLRITVYFEDTIERIAQVIEGSLPVDFSKSTDKFRIKDHGTFGYRSLHYVSALPANREFETPLPPEFRFEIQIRTVLQDAWAEVEHDLGYKSLRYKSESFVPSGIRRRFSRIASLLEIVDEEFVSIRRELDAHEQSARTALSDPSKPVAIDGVSLKSVLDEGGVRALDREVAGVLGKDLAEEVFFPEYLLKLLRLAGLKTTADLLSAIEKHGPRVPGIIPPYFEFTKRAWQLTVNSIDRVYRGYGLFFLAHVTVILSHHLEIDKVSQLASIYRELDYPDDEKSAREVAGGLFAALKETLNGA